MPRKQQQTKDKGDKEVVEFAILKSAEDKQENMKWDSVIANGMLLLWKWQWRGNKAIYNNIKESLSNNFSVIGSNDLEFVKVMQRKLLPWNKVHELSKVLQL